jgi:CDGSH-type Zn-finger protein/truncated hemoglobin YjbI
MSESSTTPRADVVDALRSLLSRARSLHADVTQAAATRPDDAAEESSLSFAARRLKHSVIRPLEDALERASGGGGTGTTGSTEEGGAGAAEPGEDPALLAGDALWELTTDATRLRLSPGLPPEVQEATAALQDLACRFAPTDDGLKSGRLAELHQLQDGLPGAIQCQRNGPYLVTNAERFTNYLGEALPTPPQMALCRCGGSAIKPLCDGTHAENGFTDDKDPKRVPDRRVTYVGEQITILDNRGTCQHSGYCTERLATAFHVDKEPFVTPSGGRMDEIIRAVRDCPSGALSYAIDGHEARAQVDHGGTRGPAIEVSKDGPYRVTGAIPLLDGNGDNERRNHGASHEHYALCRCGHSQNKPFCSGMHWYVDFKDPVPDPDHEPTIFEWCGGLPALTRMTRIFYEKYVPQDPLLAPLFANMSPDHPERVAKWLAEVFCGPKTYSEQYGGYARMVSQHIGKGLTEEKRARWVTLILQAAHDSGLPNDPEFRAAFGSYIEWGSRLAVENSQTGAHPPANMPMPHWDWQTAAGPPGSRMSALAPSGETDEQPVVLPAKDEPVTFDKHIKTLFRRHDRQSMQFAFDLWSYDDAKAHARDILERVQSGSMPCDGAWPPEKVDTFQRWVASEMRR